MNTTTHRIERRLGRALLERTFGADGHAITLSSPLLPDVVLHHTSWKQIGDDVDDARIYGGVHYRFDMDEAARQGRRVGRYILRHLLRPVHGHDPGAHVSLVARAVQ